MNNELKYKAMSLFNFFLEKYENDKRVGELSVLDFMEMAKFLNEEFGNAENQ